MTTREAETAPSTEPVSSIRTKLARPDVPTTFAENHDRLRRQPPPRLLPVVPTVRTCCGSSNRPVDLAVDDDVLASLDLALEDDSLPYLRDALGNGPAGALSGAATAAG